MCIYTCINCGEKFISLTADQCDDSSGICSRCLQQIMEDRRAKKRDKEYGDRLAEEGEVAP